MIQNHVTSLELSKRLKELGVPQDSEFSWAHCEVVSEVGDSALETGVVMQLQHSDTFIASAFLSSELGEMLPSPTGNYLGRKRFKCGWDEKGWYIELLAFNEGTHTFRGRSEADARASMLIYFIESGAINVKDL